MSGAYVQAIRSGDYNGMSDETVKIVVGAIVPVILAAMGHFYYVVKNMQHQITWLIENCRQYSPKGELYESTGEE